MTNGNNKFNLEALKTLGLIIGLLIIIAQGLMSSGSTKAETRSRNGSPGSRSASCPFARSPRRSPG